MDLSELPPFDPQWNVWPPAEDEAIREALLKAYQDGSWGRYHGPNVEQLESDLATFHDVRSVLTCASGTIAVQIALRGLNLPPDSEVILAAYDFPGNFRAIQDSGQFPVLVDINPRTWCLEAEAIEDAITEKTSAVVVSHLHGGIANMPSICEMAHRRGIAVVEDACQATGGSFKGKKLGTFGDVGVLSFGGSKLLTAGRGGAILTNRADVCQRAKIFCERGNHAFPLSELQAAVLIPQLKQLPETTKIRWENVRRLRERMSHLNDVLTPVEIPTEAEPAFYKHGWLASDFHTAQWLTGHSEHQQLPLASGFHGFTKRPTSQARKNGKLTHADDARLRTVILHHPILQNHDATDWIRNWISRGLERLHRNESKPDKS